MSTVALDKGPRFKGHMARGLWNRGSSVSMSHLALFGISIATALLGFLGYRAATFRAEREETRRL